MSTRHSVCLMVFWPRATALGVFLSPCDAVTALCTSRLTTSLLGCRVIVVLWLGFFFFFFNLLKFPPFLSVVYEEGERNDSVIPLHVVLICCSAAWGRTSSCHVSLGQAGCRQPVRLALQTPGLQEKHPWGRALSWCHGLIKILFVSPVSLGVSLISLYVVFVRLVVLLSGTWWVDFCVLQEPEHVASSWQHRLKYIRSLVRYKEGTAGVWMKHHLYFEMDHCFIPASLVAFWEWLPFPHSSK